MYIGDVTTKRIIELCEAKDLSYEMLAFRAKVPLSAISEILEHHTDITIPFLKKICDGLEITLGEFFSSLDFDQSEINR